MSAEIDIISNFLSSGIGVTLQIIGIIGAVIPAIKYFNARFDQRVKKELVGYVNPMIIKTCEQLKDLANSLDRYQTGNDTAIKYINEKIDDLHKLILRDKP